MNKIVKGILRQSYHDIFYLMSNRMIFEKNKAVEIKQTIDILNEIERLAGEKPNTFFLEEKEGIKKNGIFNY